MRIAACSLLLIVACDGGADGDFPVNPGGGSGTSGSGSGTPDARPGDGGATVTGRVCGVSEILVWDDCDVTGLDGAMVTIGTAAATAVDDGTFEIPTPTGSDLVWRVTGAGRLKSLREFSADYEIQSITTALYEDITANANVAVGSGLGTIFAEVVSMQLPVSGATATLAGQLELVRYDDVNASGGFGVDETHASGIIWIPNVTPGANVTFRVTPPAAVGAPKDVTVPVEADTATFVTVEFTAPPAQ